MRLPTVHFAIAATIAAAPSWGTAQAQANPANCTLPPPLVCPPDPPPGPKTVGQIDTYIEGLDSTIETNESASKNLPAASTAVMKSIAIYVQALTLHRKEVADYRGKMDPEANSKQPPMSAAEK